MKRTCYIVDDEPLAIEVIASYVNRHGEFELIGTQQNAIEAFRELTSRPPDVLFLDIEMPGLSGLELLKSLARPPFVILTTAHREYAVEGFELDVVDYLVKPVSFERFLKAMGRVERAMPRPGTVTAAEGDPTQAPEVITFRSGRKNVPVALEDILYLESRGDAVAVATRQREIRVNRRLVSLADELTPLGFIRIHRSFIVRVAEVRAWTATEVQLKNRTLPIGRTYRKHVARTLQTTIRNR